MEPSKSGRSSQSPRRRVDVIVGYADAYYRKKNIGTREKTNTKKTTARIMNFIAELELAGHKVDMMVIQRRAGKHSPMRMESRARDRRRPVVA